MKEKKTETDLKVFLKELADPFAVALEGINLLKSYFDSHHDLRQKQVFNSVLTNLERASALLKGIQENVCEGGSAAASIHFDILHQIQQVCATHDQLFLQRQLRYRVTASNDLPKVFSNPDQIFIVLSHLVSNAIKFSPRGSEIEIKAKEMSLRQGAGVEVSVVNESPDFTEKDRYQIFERFYKSKEGDKTAGLGLAVCREIVQKAGGQLWVDIPTKGRVAFAFVLPCAEIVAPSKVKGHQTYKYDITVANYKDLKEDIGSEKCALLLHRIEEAVRKLVRYPIDVVATFETHGVISTIYETNEGGASSVATRISQKLGEESFKMGKNTLPVTFKYHLSVLQ
ncbi:MAG: HAMP domain-containing histidine kinase [Deltaproteobacteria bacterium]|nr:HAMP domain-containing histidine kinase [Deltaproteobacteria bacterium]MBI2342344.1 HAMP domain-containing histidine kinase [Deltaproteobacteria bacterium]